MLHIVDTPQRVVLIQGSTHYCAICVAGQWVVLTSLHVIMPRLCGECACCCDHRMHRAAIMRSSLLESIVCGGGRRGADFPCPARSRLINFTSACPQAGVESQRGTAAVEWSPLCSPHKNRLCSTVILCLNSGVMSQMLMYDVVA